jgi:hypothetical protein
MGTATEVLARASAATSTVIPNANLRHAEPARHAARCAQHLGTRRENDRQPGSESSCTAVGRDAPSRPIPRPIKEDRGRDGCCQPPPAQIRT